MTSHEALVAGENLLLDSLAAEVFRAFRTDRVSAILLKGPSIARWLYPPGGRPYRDVDVLVAPPDVERAHRALRSLGFSSASLYGRLDRRGSTDWRRGWASVDVHECLNLLEQGDHAQNWEVLSALTETMELAGEQVPVLQPPARVVSLALHALHDSLECERYGFSAEQSGEDLRRALTAVGPDVWTEAGQVAGRLGAHGELGAALRMIGAPGLAESIGLPATDPRNVRIRAAAIDGATESAALAAEHLAGLSAREKLAWMFMKLFPRPSYLRARSKMANRGHVGIVIAYLLRPLVLALGLLRMLAGLRAARR